VVGFSMGGALALKLATERPVNKLGLISSCFKIKQPWYYFGSPQGWANKINNLIPFVRKLKIGQINDSDGLLRYAAYKHLPLKSIKIAERIGQESFSIASRVKSPVLMLHSQGVLF
jgi:esterase/lipase